MTNRGWTGIALALAGTLAGCATAADKVRLETSALRAGAHAQMPERRSRVNAALAICEPLRAQGERPWSAAADCYNRRFLGAFGAGDPPYRTALFVNLAARSAIADRVDRGMMTAEEGRGQLERADKALVDDARAAIKPGGLTTLQKEQALAVATQDELLQRQTDTELLLQAFERIKPRP